MSELRAEPLSPIDAATLWPQLGRLDHEVLSHRGENLLISSGLAATGLGRLPRLPKTMVLGVRRGLRYRGLLVARSLEGGAGWEVVSLRLAREDDDEAIGPLLATVASEVGARAGRSIYLRCPDETAHREPLRRGGFMPYTRELLFSLPRVSNTGGDLFRSEKRSDRHGVFRLYCRVVPEPIRRNEAPTQQEWRALHASYDCSEEFVFEHEGTIAAWVGRGHAEVRVLAESQVEGLIDAALDRAEEEGSGRGTLVVPEFQFEIERAARARGYLAAGARFVAVRRLAALQTLMEVVSVPADTAPVPQ